MVENITLTFISSFLLIGIPAGIAIALSEAIKPSENIR